MHPHHKPRRLCALLQLVAAAVALAVLQLTVSSAEALVLQKLPPLTAGHKNVSSLRQIKRYASKYPATPIILGVSAASCGSCGLVEPSYKILSRHMTKQRIPFLRVDADTSPELAEKCTGNHGRLPAHGVYFQGEFFRYDGTGVSRHLDTTAADSDAISLLAVEVAGLELFALKLRAPRVLHLNSTADVEAFVARATGNDDGRAPVELFAGMDSWRQGVNEYPSIGSEEWAARILRRHLPMPAVAVVGFDLSDGGADDEAVKDFASASQLLGNSHAHLFFGLVRNSSIADSFLERGWFKSAPAVTLHRSVSNDGTGLTISSRLSATAPASALALDFFFPDPTKYGPPTMTSWIATHSLPLVGEVTHHTFGILAEPDLPIVVLFLDLGDSWSYNKSYLPEHQSLLSALKAVAREFRGRLVFGYANGIELDSQMKGLGLSYGNAVLPALAVDMRDGLALPFSGDGLNFDDQGNVLDAASITALCHDIVSHRIPDDRFYERNPLAGPPARAYTGTEQVLESMKAASQMDDAAAANIRPPPPHSEL